jgi:TRAP-type C4-dicarboxylate transport system substrate-binding protein
VVAAVALLVAAAAVAAADIKIATVAPEGSQWMQAMRAAAAEIKTRTAGRVVIKLYGGGVQGNEKKVLRKIRIGQLQGGAFTANGISEVYPDIVVYGLPMVFESQDEVNYVRRQMDSLLMNGLEQAGFVSFGLSSGGFAHILSQRPVVRAADMRGQKIWLADGDRVSYAAMEALQLAPVVLPVTDVLTGLQTGLLDVVAAPPVAVVALQWHTRVKYMTSLPLMYTMGLMAIDKRAFDALSDSDQAAVREVMTGIYRRFEEQSHDDDLQAQKALQANGIRFVDAEPQDVQLWRRTVAETNRRLGEQGVYSPALLEQMMSHLREFRSRQSAREAPAGQGGP